MILTREMEKENKMVKRRVLLLVCTLLFSAFAGVFSIENCIASGNTIYVDDSNIAGPWNGTQEYPYRYIQDGINAASSGDTVYVYTGTYNENIEIIKSISLIGQDGASTTINSAVDNKHTVKINGTSLAYLNFVNISGFTIRNVVGLGNGWDGIYAEYVNNCSITDCIIKNSDDGTKLKRFYHSTIIGNTFQDNEAVGLYLMYSGNNEIKDNIIENNLKGIYIYSSSNNNEIYENTIARNNLYGIHILQSANNIFHYNHFTNNGQNALDQSTNYWSHNNLGNYWEDYDGVDENPQDGVGDTSYDIPGGSNQDEYPLGYFGPTAQIVSISPNPATYGESISFNGNGADNDGYIIEWEWRSDRVLSNSEDFSSSSLSVGTHTIKFRVKDNDGKWSSYDEETLTVNSQSSQDNKKPAATIDYINPNPATSETIIYFNGIGTDEDGEITEWEWNSSIDEVISNEQSFDTSDLSVGIHTIEFQVKDNDNEWSEKDSETLIINLDSSSTTEDGFPVADTGGAYSGKINDTINFDGSNSYDDGTIVEYLWNFGDGTTGTGVSPTHTYSVLNNYTITLMVTDDEGNISTDVTYVTIVQSTEQSGSGNEGLIGFEFEIPFPLIVIFEIVFIIAVIALFFFWIKRK